MLTPDLQQIVEKPFCLSRRAAAAMATGWSIWTLAAYEQDFDIPLPALIVFGPFMPPEQRGGFAARAGRLQNVHAITFNARLEALIARAAGVVAMGGYNTFCEILSFDKPALIMPRTAPRLEQYIRAARAAELGLVAMLPKNAGGIRRPWRRRCAG